MAFKYFTVVLALLCAFQLYEAARLQPRSADGETTTDSDVLKNVGESITRQLESWRSGLEEAFKGAPSVDQVVANLTSGFQTLSGKVETAAKGLVESLSTATTTEKP